MLLDKTKINLKGEIIFKKFKNEKCKLQRINK